MLRLPLRYFIYPHTQNRNPYPTPTGRGPSTRDSCALLHMHPTNAQHSRHTHDRLAAAYGAGTGATRWQAGDDTQTGDGAHARVAHPAPPLHHLGAANTPPLSPRVNPRKLEILRPPLWYSYLPRPHLYAEPAAKRSFRDNGG
jgi:hypothetical protein